MKPLQTQPTIFTGPAGRDGEDKPGKDFGHRNSERGAAKCGYRTACSGASEDGLTFRSWI